MTISLSVPARDRDFCRAILDAVFSNPFNPARAAHFERLIGDSRKMAPDEIVEAINRAVSTRMGRWEESGQADLRRYRGEDLEVMRIVLLFESYHLSYRDFDRLIELQLKAGKDSIAVSFAGEALERLQRRGFSKDESVRFFSLFYQLRRAHYFIARGLIGESPCMVEFRRHLWNNVFTHDILRYDRFFLGRMEDFSTLLLGETGTGKGAAAAAIGRSGYIAFDQRKGRFTESFMAAFVSTNLSQFQENLIESELFGHRKGAFTGAVESHDGILSLCSGQGAVFLDEIGEVSPSIQIKLLRILQERTFCPVGSRVEKPFMGRVIAATNRSLEELQETGGFRPDFYFRLCSDSIVIPTLRQRVRESFDELGQMVRHLCVRIVGEDVEAVAMDVERILVKCVGKNYEWPGNVRELEQAIRRILLTENYEGVKPKLDLDRAFIRQVENGEVDAEELMAGYCSMLYRRTPNYEAVGRIADLDRRTVKKYTSNDLLMKKG